MTTATTKTEHMWCVEDAVSRRETAIGSMMHKACLWWAFSVLCLLWRYFCQALVCVDIHLHLLRRQSL
jgi:hypothetical protein